MAGDGESFLIALPDTDLRSDSQSDRDASPPPSPMRTNEPEELQSLVSYCLTTESPSEGTTPQPGSMEQRFAMGSNRRLSWRRQRVPSAIMLAIHEIVPNVDAIDLPPPCSEMKREETLTVSRPTVKIQPTSPRDSKSIPKKEKKKKEKPEKSEKSSTPVEPLSPRHKRKREKSDKSTSTSEPASPRTREREKEREKKKKEKQDKAERSALNTGDKKRIGIPLNRIRMPGKKKFNDSDMFQQSEGLS